MFQPGNLDAGTKWTTCPHGQVDERLTNTAHGRLLPARCSAKRSFPCRSLEIFATRAPNAKLADALTTTPTHSPTVWTIWPHGASRRGFAECGRARKPSASDHAVRRQSYCEPGWNCAASRQRIHHCRAMVSCGWLRLLPARRSYCRLASVGKAGCPAQEPVYNGTKMPVATGERRRARYGMYLSGSGCPVATLATAN